MDGDAGMTLLPARVDGLVRRLAPAFAPGALDAGASAGTGLRLLRPALWLVVAAALAQSLLHVVDVAFLQLAVTSINADADHSIDGWMGTLTTGSTAAAALQLGLLSPAVRRPLLLLAALCAYLSLDDMLALHEMVARLALRLPLYGHSGYDLWPLVYLPLLSVVGWLLLRTARSIDARAGRLIAYGLLALALAVVLEALAPVLYAAGSGHGQPAYESEVVVEEALELLGWGAMAVGMTAAVLDLVGARAGAGAPRGPSAECDQTAQPSRDTGPATP